MVAKQPKFRRNFHVNIHILFIQVASKVYNSKEKADRYQNFCSLQFPNTFEVLANLL